MPTEFLSDEWVAAMDEAARRRPDLADAVARPIVIQEEVVGPRGTCTLHVRIGGGESFVRSGPAPDGAATVRIRQDLSTAVAIAAGELSAQRAFMTGRLRIGGDLDVLLEHTEALALLDDVFADVRSRTIMPTDVARPASDEGRGPVDA